MAKWITSCSQHIVLVIWIEFPPKLYQVTLLLARKVKLPKYQEIPIISAGGKKQFCCCPWWMWLKKKKKIANLTCSNFTLQNGKFCFTGNSQLSHLFISSGLCFLVCDNRNQNQQTEMLKKGANSISETRKWASATLLWSLNPWISRAWSTLSKRPPLPLPPSLIFTASLPRYQKTYLLCTISLEYSATVKKTQNFPVF